MKADNAANKPERIEADYEYAADAWFDHQMIMAAMRHRSENIKLAREYASRLAAEKEAESNG